MVSAATTEGYTSSLEDLTRDPKFNPEDYPDKPNDYTLEVIQIGEGVNGELFIYVYQPSHNTKDLKAKYINMSLQNYLDKNPVYKLYSLTWLNSNGVFDKYVVNNFTVSNDLKRYYNIAAIYRPFDSSIGDSKAEALDDTNTYMGYEVGYCYGTQYYNDTLIYDAVKVQVVDVEIVDVGTIRFKEGFHLYVDMECHAHFMAFKVKNYDVKEIYDATVTYTIYHNDYVDGVKQLENPETITKDISCKQYGQNDPIGLFGYQYTWDRIQTIEQFNTMLSNYKNEKVQFDENALGSAEFVFLFEETNYRSYLDNYKLNQSETLVKDEAILRLHFATEKGAYNLGVVSDIVSDDGAPDFVVGIGDNVQNKLEDLMEANRTDFEKIMAALLMVLLIVVFAIFIVPILTPIAKLILHGFGLFFGALWEIFSFPFRYLFKGGIK